MHRKERQFVFCSILLTRESRKTRRVSYESFTQSECR